MVMPSINKITTTTTRIIESKKMLISFTLVAISLLAGVTNAMAPPRGPSPPPIPEEDALPNGWTHHTTEDGDKFYFHAETNVRQWEVPTGTPEIYLPDGWTVHTAENGRKFYYQEESNVRQWEVPTEAPAAPPVAPAAAPEKGQQCDGARSLTPDDIAQRYVQENRNVPNGYDAVVKFCEENDILAQANIVKKGLLNGKPTPVKDRRKIRKIIEKVKVLLNEKAEERRNQKDLKAQRNHEERRERKRKERAEQRKAEAQQNEKAAQQQRARDRAVAEDRSRRSKQTRKEERELVAKRRNKELPIEQDLDRLMAEYAQDYHHKCNKCYKASPADVDVCPTCNDCRRCGGRGSQSDGNFDEYEAGGGSVACDFCDGTGTTVRLLKGEHYEKSSWKPRQRNGPLLQRHAGSSQSWPYPHTNAKILYNYAASKDRLLTPAQATTHLMKRRGVLRREAALGVAAKMKRRHT